MDFVDNSRGYFGYSGVMLNCLRCVCMYCCSDGGETSSHIMERKVRVCSEAVDIAQCLHATRHSDSYVR